MIQPSTFSIVAYDPALQAWGIAVASKFPAVGAVVPWAKADAGAIATQAHANTSFGPTALDLMKQGHSAEQAFNLLRLTDDGIEHRQVGLVDRLGGSFTFTGNQCFDWAGGIAGPGYAIQGNLLAGPQVVNKMEAAFTQSKASFATRLVQALKAGEDAGGDKRGKQSAAIIVVKDKGGYSGFNDRMVDYRVDDAAEPVLRLIELLEYHELLFGKSSADEKLSINGQIKDGLDKVLRKQVSNYPSSTKDFRSALNEFISRENFEDRCDLDTIDKPAYEYILGRFDQ